MKKILAALALSVVATVPAGAAWGDGSDGARDTSGPTASGVGRLIASGCHDGVVFVFDYSTGTTTTGGSCTMESIRYTYVFG